MPKDDRWAKLAVRRWIDVLDRRRPDDDYIDEDNSYAEALESRRIHELRGLVMAQVAEIENLLYCLVNDYLPALRALTPSQVESLRRAPAGALLKYVSEILALLGLSDQNSRQLTTVKEMIQRRNVLVHATVHVGFSYSSFRDQREAVIALLASHVPGGGSDEIGEYELEQDLLQAYVALESAVDVWESVVDNPRAATLRSEHQGRLRADASPTEDEPPF